MYLDKNVKYNYIDVACCCHCPALCSIQSDILICDPVSHWADVSGSTFITTTMIFTIHFQRPAGTTDSYAQFGSFQILHSRCVNNKMNNVHTSSVFDNILIDRCLEGWSWNRNDVTMLQTWEGEGRLETWVLRSVARRLSSSRLVFTTAAVILSSVLSDNKMFTSQLRFLLKHYFWICTKIATFNGGICAYL